MKEHGEGLRAGREKRQLIRRANERERETEEGEEAEAD